MVYRYLISDTTKKHRPVLSLLTTGQDDATMNIVIWCWHRSTIEKALGSDDPRAFLRAVMIGVPRWCHSGCAYLQPQHLQDQCPENAPKDADKQLKQ